jgi:hypothetical protein
VKVRIQNLPLHNQDMLPAQTLFTSPPDEKWTLGHYNTAIINVEAGADWPVRSLNGKATVHSSQFVYIQLTAAYQGMLLGNCDVSCVHSVRLGPIGLRKTSSLFTSNDLMYVARTLRRNSQSLSVSREQMVNVSVTSFCFVRYGHSPISFHGMVHPQTLD